MRKVVSHKGRLRLVPEPLRPVVQAVLDPIRRGISFARLHPSRIAATGRWTWQLVSAIKARRRAAGLTVAVDVTPTHIKGFIDGAVVAEAALAGREVDVRIEMVPCRPLGLASWRTVSDIRNITLEER